MLLDFEKPIVKLEEKLVKMQEAAKAQNAPALMASIAKLANDIKALQKKTFQNLTRWQRVQLARHPDRPYTLDYIQQITEKFFELHGDRFVGDDKAIVGGFGTINGQTMMFIGHQKGRTTKERQSRNFGMANPEGYRKALRLMRLAEKFKKPIITFIDTPGAYPGVEAEERGQAEAIASNIQAMFGLRVPIISIVIGEGASGGALGIAIGDYVLMLEHAWYSVITPESCSSILWKSWDYKEQAAEMLQVTANDMSNFRLIDGLIKEPIGGAHRDLPTAAALIKESILDHLEKLSSKSIEKLVQERTEKFCGMGRIG
ncbi:Acetyl-coenzyme A carboxylase carboxyl transferase subunit alpha [Cardinium endosymbiont cEper1 of Encarsia pergandiella]|uniref:acetyl-CoA carboxylase carboxyltransferase subunit alpha n=1 Tax=Cardinium endosymbiont of Encarsia pergandiella TaxID=249402 RepID=UPI00027EA9EA|nr:acetyl-CoA carboxylase carboxyltransferase subunit alpha [Cardinium endosymbiont of Encarsia pergandiella]CCM09864.1 Acetyl-coenzyme A carboxylase carboxyl transferase subunit alpha [Cardinium endosymbiont cEper1 of Encarsia pergandiella]